MAFKRIGCGRSDKRKKGVRIKSSYYTFSKEYPIDSFGHARKADKRKQKRAVRLRAVLCTLIFVAIAFVAYFAVDFGLKISYKEPSDNLPAQTNAATQTNSVKSGIKALYMPSDRLNDTKYIKRLIKKIKAKDADSVVIDFKAQDGKIIYSSSVSYAMLAKCAMFDNETVRKAIDTFKSENINIVAGIYCFEDAVISSENSELAVKYLNSDVTWLDGLEENGGKSWLNPYSKKACDYIRQIIEEVRQMGVNSFILKSVCFPTGEDTDKAGYPGEESKKNRNQTLLSFIESVRKLLPADCTVLVSQTASDALNGNDSLYFGSISKNAADGICIETKIRPEEYAVDKKTDFISMMSLFANIAQGMNEKSRLIPIIEKKEYSRKYVRTILNSGYDSFIIYEEDGNY